MPAYSDYLLAGIPRAGVYIRLVNNVTNASYVSVASTDSNGLFTFSNIPVGMYTVYFGPTSTGPWTATGDTNYIVMPNVTNAITPPGWQTAWNNALVNAVNTPCWAMSHGASIAQGGSVTSDVLAKTYWALWRNQVITNYSLYGDFFAPTWSTNWTSASTTPTWPFTYNTAPDAWFNGVGSFCPSYSAHLSGSPLFHMTHPSASLGYNGRSCDLIVFDNAAGTITYNINGGSNQTFTTTGSLTLKRFSLTGMPNSASNVVNIVSFSASTQAYLLGIAWYPGSTGPGNSGVGFAWMAAGGHTMHDWMLEVTGGPIVDRIAPFAGPTSALNVTPPYTTPIGFGFPYAPNLLLLDLTDDPIFVAYTGNTRSSGVTPTIIVNGIDPASYQFGIARLVQACRYGSAGGCSVLFQLPNVPSYTASDVAGSSTYQTTYQPQNIDPYYHSILLMAQLYNCAVLNTHAQWGQRAVGLGFLTSNNPHPTDAGHTDIFNRLVGVGL